MPEQPAERQDAADAFSAGFSHDAHVQPGDAWGASQPDWSTGAPHMGAGDTAGDGFHSTSTVQQSQGAFGDQPEAPQQQDNVFQLNALERSLPGGAQYDTGDTRAYLAQPTDAARSAQAYSAPKQKEDHLHKLFPPKPEPPAPAAAAYENTYNQFAGGDSTAAQHLSPQDDVPAAALGGGDASSQAPPEPQPQPSPYEQPPAPPAPQEPAQPPPVQASQFDRQAAQFEPPQMQQSHFEAPAPPQQQPPQPQYDAPAPQQQAATQPSPASYASQLHQQQQQQPQQQHQQPQAQYGMQYDAPLNGGYMDHHADAGKHHDDYGEQQHDDGTGMDPTGADGVHKHSASVEGSQAGLMQSHLGGQQRSGQDLPAWGSVPGAAMPQDPYGMSRGSAQGMMNPAMGGMMQGMPGQSQVRALPQPPVLACACVVLE